MHLNPKFLINRWKGAVYKLSCNKYWCRSHWSNKGWFPSSVWACGDTVTFLCVRDCPLTCGVLGRCERCTAQNSKPNEREESARGTCDHRCGGNGVWTVTWQVSRRVLHVSHWEWWWLGWSSASEITLTDRMYRYIYLWHMVFRHFPWYMRC